MSEIKVVEYYKVGDKVFETLEEAENHIECENLISIIKERCSSRLYSNGSLCCVDDIEDLVDMLQEGGFKIVEDNTQ